MPRTQGENFITNKIAEAVSEILWDMYNSHLFDKIKTVKLKFIYLEEKGDFWAVLVNSNAFPTYLWIDKLLMDVAPDFYVHW